MSNTNHSVENPMSEGVPVDAALAPAEATDERTLTLSDMLSQPQEGQPDEAQPDGAQQAEEPGTQPGASSEPDHEPLTPRQLKAVNGRNREIERRSHKQGYEAGYQRAVAELESRLEQKFNTILAPLQKTQVQQLAQELVAGGMQPEIAQELAQYRVQTQFSQAQKTPEPTAVQGTQPMRDAQGRFTSAPDPQAQLQKHAAQLRSQAGEIQAEYGVDMLALFRDDPTVREKVTSREWDFWRALPHAMKSRTAPAGTPAPVRAPNANLGRAGLSSDDLKRINAALERGDKIDLSR